MNKKQLALLVLVALVVTPVVAQAKTIQELANLIVGWMQIFGSAVATIMIIWVGILFLLSRGDATKVAEARMALLWGIVGVAIIFGASYIISFATPLLSGLG